MDPSIALVAIAGGLFFFVLPIYLFARSRALSKKADSLEMENTALRKELQGVVRRVYKLEREFENPRHNAEPSVTGISVPVAEANVAKPIPVPADRAETKPQLTAPPALLIPKVTLPPAIETPRPPEPAKQESRPSSFIPSPTPPPTHAAKATEPRRWADLEERLGANWLNKIGTAAFVIGVALLLNYSMHYLGAAGKIGLGYALSTGFIAAGILGERKERYRIASRAVLGGGWALAYFTTYALHNIDAVRLVTSPVVGFGLLFAAAAAMVAHSLRYDSEVTTGFAYLLAFASVAVSTIPIGALIATALLAASLVVILRARKWYALEPFAIAATYIVHQRWISQIYDAMGGRKPFPEFRISVALLSTYWLIYMISYFLRSEEGTRESQVLTASFLLNAFGYFAVLHYQAFHPEWRFWFLLVAGAVYLGVSAYARGIGRRWGFILASTLGATLIVAAVPYRYSGRGLELFWLIEAEALLIVGWRVADAHLRRLGWAGAGLLAGYVAFHDLPPRFEVWQPPNTKLGWMLFALAIAFYLNGRLKDRLGPQATQLDEVASECSPVIATSFLLAGDWVALPFMWTGLAWIVAAVLLVNIGQRFRYRMLPICGHASALLGVARLVIVNMPTDDAWHHISLRLATVGASSVLLYLFAGSDAAGGVDEIPARDSVSNLLSRVGGQLVAYTGAATLLVALLIWQEVTTAAIGLAWGLFGFVLLEGAKFLPERHLKLQGRLLLLASFARIFFADLNSSAHIGAIPVPVLTIALLAAIYYFTGFNTEDSPRIRVALLWFGTISIAALLRFQLPAEWVAVGWAALTVVLYALGRGFTLTTFSRQAYAMALVVGIRCAFDNFYQVGAWRFTSVRTATVSLSAALLYILFAASQLAKKHVPAELSGANADQAEGNSIRKIWALIETHPQHLFFFIPTTLLTVLLSLEVRRGFLTAAWGLEALVVFLAVLKMEERAYRWFSLLLFLLCVGRLVGVDIWTLDALGRIVSFMALGATLLAVSFLCARHREIFRRVL